MLSLEGLDYRSSQPSYFQTSTEIWIASAKAWRYCWNLSVLKICAAALHHKVPVAPSPRDQLHWSEEVLGVKVWHRWDFYSEYQHKEVAVVPCTVGFFPVSPS